MTSKEIKAALKAARTAIQAKDYQTALGHCNIILDKDANNYNALVFAGHCLSETNQLEQAQKKYRIAIETQPDQILAYQGLSKLYMKLWKSKRTKDELTESIKVCEKVLAVTERKEPKKRVELCLYLCESHVENEDFLIAFEIVGDELRSCENFDNDLKLELYDAAMKIVDKAMATDKIKKHIDLVDESFKFLMKAIKDEGTLTKHLEIYLTFLRQNQQLLKDRVDNILDVCGNFSTKFPTASLPSEILIQAYIQNYEHPSLSNFDQKLEKLTNSAQPFSTLCLGYLDFKSNKFENAFIKLKSVMPRLSTFLPGWTILCECALKIHNYLEAKNLAKKGLAEYKAILSSSKALWLFPLVPLDCLKLNLTKCLATGLCESQNTTDISTGVETFRKLLTHDPGNVQLLLGMSIGLIKLDKCDEAKETLNNILTVDSENMDAAAWMAYIVFKTGDTAEGISQLESISPPSSLSLYLLGKCMWEAGGEYRKDKKNCFSALVKAAKVDPHRAETFLLLGHFYSKVQRDSTRAKGCYQKSYNLDSTNQDAAASLADAFVAEGDTDSAIDLYEDITKKAGSSGGKWAWLRLGLYKLKAKDVTNAIQCFQSALRIESDDSICWECLGEGYLHRGSYTAAWKAFDRAHQLNPQSVYSLYQMSRVKQVQGSYTEAISEYTEVLKLVPDYVPALQGLAESELRLARLMFSEGRFQTGVERSENAIRVLAQACLLRKDLCCLWKLLGDCCILVHSLSSTVVTMSIPSVLVDKNTGAGNKLINVGKDEILLLGTRCFCRAVHLQPENASLWHDLGVSYFRQSENTQTNSGTEFANKAMNAMKKAITLESSNHLLWSSLGVVAASSFVNSPALAQHCFLTSIKKEKNNVIAWSNLATLYLSTDHVKQAHEAFKVAQSLDPSFTNSWVGQALIAETIGSDETMDLYRHSTELGLQKQGATGYCFWVARVIADLSNRDSAVFKDNIRNMNAVSTAVTQMSKMSTKNPNCAWSTTLHGFLLEHSGLNRCAEDAYRLAHKASEDNNYEKAKDVTMNLARTLCKNGKFDEAIAMYNNYLEELDVYNMCGLALAYYRSKNYKEAEDTYAKAGQLATTDSDKAQIMVAIAMTRWKMGQQDEAKTLLYQCFQACKPGLQALLALGIQMNDSVLIGAAVGELMKSNLEDKPERDVADDCMLISTAAKKFGDPNMALNEVQKALHRYPYLPLLRTLLCRVLLEVQGNGGVMSTPVISSIGEKLYEKNSESNPLHRDSELWKAEERHKKALDTNKCFALSTLAVGSAVTKLSLEKQVMERLKAAQKLVRMHPYDPSSWVLLSTACHARDVMSWINGSEIKSGNLTSTLAQRSACEKHINFTQHISNWSSVLTQSESILHDTTNSDAKLVALLSAASTTQDKAKLQLVLKDITAVLGNTSNPGKSAKYFSELLNRMGMYQVSKKMSEKAISMHPKNITQQLSIYYEMFRQLFNRVSKHKTKSKDSEEGLKYLISEILKLDAKSPLSLLIQGLSYRLENNHRKTKSFLNRVINSSDIMSDMTRSVAIWYLYMTLHERNDATEIQKLVDKALELEDGNVAKIIELLPVS